MKKDKLYINHKVIEIIKRWSGLVELVTKKKKKTKKKCRYILPEPSVKVLHFIWNAFHALSTRNINVWIKLNLFT